MANPSLANGYNSCVDMKDDILNAIKYHVNSIIVSESENSWIDYCRVGESCIRDDVCRTNNCTEGKCVPAYRDPNDTSPSGAPSSAGTSTVGTSKEDLYTAPEAGLMSEDSFDTNTQVDGVDEADVVKANKDFVFAAYGDILYVWNSTDGSKSKLSMTIMPREEEDPECTIAPTPSPWPTAMPVPTTPWPSRMPTTQWPGRTPFPTENKLTRRSTPNPTENDTQRKLSSFWYGGYNPCIVPKPRIHGLLLADDRLTAIVSEHESVWARQEDGPTIINNAENIVIRVYDAKNVPTNGSPLRLLGEQTIKGVYTSARSIGSKGVIISNLPISTHSLTSNLYRYNSMYCGFNSTEYEQLATEFALDMVDQITDIIVDELALQLDGKCDTYFQLAAMQSGNSTNAPSSNFLEKMVQITTFDMSGVDGVEVSEIPVNVAGAFQTGYSSYVYASENFVTSVSVGHEYKSGEWKSATYLQGFDISGLTPKPYSYAELSGSPLNQYSLDLYENHLRVVTTQTMGWWPDRNTTNKLWVLKVPHTVESPQMVITGETGHLGKPGEEVKAVRFMEDKAYVVTFENTDPFYILNVSDPTNPLVLGELEIPGFSSYLHPIQIDGVEMMIGVGRYVDPTTGSDDGAKISLFDVSDVMEPTENATYIDMGAYSSAGNDFYSFRYLPLNQKLILPKSKWTYSDRDNFDGFVVYDVKLGNITPSYEIEHSDSSYMYTGCFYNARMPARSLVFQSQLTTILSHSVISTSLDTGEQNWNVSLDEGLNITETECRGYFW